MTDMGQIRKLSLQSIQKISEAEKKQAESKNAAEKAREHAIVLAGKQHQQTMNWISQINTRIKDYLHVADQNLNKLQLKAKSVAIPGNVNHAKDLKGQITQETDLVQKELRSLEVLAREMERERKKWWKFW